MGAAIENFDDAGAVVVARYRFAGEDDQRSYRPAVRRLCYYERRARDCISRMSGMVFRPRSSLIRPHYKLADQLDAALAEGVPSLLRCKKLEVRGPGNVFLGLPD